ncbi:alpha/beta hydrolase [Gemmobacter serpentinus]|uniref:alpha/beta hydrolase n=1 Tax=Gemmobacter serpentinus TaxID=2652247 RepID=UPI00124F0840|nr:alpha/beta hydrolase [Gemmobacter serpentinus]
MQDLSNDYANADFIAGAADFPPRWKAQAAAFRAGLGARARLDLAYGSEARQALDLFLPDTSPKGLLVFVHGGYWLAFGREDWSHLAAGALARGWACAMPSYTLAPKARIGAMTHEIAQACRFAASLLPEGLPIVVTGHSAGGHLSARMACSDITLPGLCRVVPISPLSLLAPLMQTGMNANLHLDAEECATESPALLTRRPGISAHIHVGGQERPAFLWQARSLSEAWDCGWTVAPGRHHFDVVEDLADPGSALCGLLIDAATPAAT